MAERVGKAGEEIIELGIGNPAIIWTPLQALANFFSDGSEFIDSAFWARWGRSVDRPFVPPLGLLPECKEGFAQFRDLFEEKARILCRTPGPALDVDQSGGFGEQGDKVDVSRVGFLPG